MLFYYSFFCKKYIIEEERGMDMNHMTRIAFIRHTKEKLSWFYFSLYCISFIGPFLGFWNLFRFIFSQFPTTNLLHPVVLFVLLMTFTALSTTAVFLVLTHFVEKLEETHVDVSIQKVLPRKQVQSVLGQLVYADMKAHYQKGREKQIKQKYVFHPVKQENVLINVASKQKEPLLFDLKNRIQARNMKMEERIHDTLYSDTSSDSSCRLTCPVCSDTIYIAEGKVSHPCSCPSIRQYKNTQS